MGELSQEVSAGCLKEANSLLPGACWATCTQWVLPAHMPCRALKLTWHLALQALGYCLRVLLTHTGSQVSSQ